MDAMPDRQPRLILHVGTPKAGSTALQKSLARRSAELAEQGIFYPTHDGVAHHVLTVPLDFAGNSQRGVAQRFGFDEATARQAFDEFWGRLETDIAARGPETVILSSEFLFARAKGPAFDAFAAQLRSAFSDVEVVVYFRQPSKFLASKVSQDVKRSSTLPPLAPYTFRAPLTAWLSAFPDRVRIMLYERARLRDGDIAADFFDRVLSLPFVPEPAGGQFNTAFSAEASQALQDFQRRTEPDKDGLLTNRKKVFREALRRADKRVPGHRSPVLRKDIADYIDASAIDLKWLSETFGLTFEGLDYSRLDANAAPPARDFTDILDYLQIDEARLAELRKTALRRYWTMQAQGLLRLGRRP